MLRNLWLTFAQAVTVGLAALFIVSTLRPEWLPLRRDSAPAQQGGAERIAQAPPAPLPAPPTREANGSILSYAMAPSGRPRRWSTSSRRRRCGCPATTRCSTTRCPQFFGDQHTQRQQTSSLGSGVIVSEDGLILTNHHVVESADDIEVLLADGRRGKAKLVGSDRRPIWRCCACRCAACRWWNSATRPSPGSATWCWRSAIPSASGRPSRWASSARWAATSSASTPSRTSSRPTPRSTPATRRRAGRHHGRLLGINTAIYSRTGGSLGIGFAIPVSTAKMVMEQIVATGTVTRGYIGVEPQDVTPELAEAFKLPRKDGAIIAGVMRGGPADRAGVKVGDILFEVEGQPVTNTARCSI